MLIILHINLKQSFFFDTVTLWEIDTHISRTKLLQVLLNMEIKTAC